MNPAIRALAWKEGRSFYWSLLGVPIALGIVCRIFWPDVDGAWADFLLLGAGPIVAAAIGGSGFSSERESLDWLKARAVAPERILLVKLGWQFALLLVCALSVVSMFFVWTLVGRLGWSPSLDAPVSWTLPIALLSWLTAFAWSVGLSWLSRSTIGIIMGGLLLTWLQAAALLTPAELLSGRPEVAVLQWAWFVPGFLGPPLLLAAWAYRRWNPLTRPWPVSGMAIAGTVVLVLALGGFLQSLQPAIEVRDLAADLSLASSITTHVNAEHPEHVAHEVVLRDGTTRVVVADEARPRVVLGPGTRFAGWTANPIPRAVVVWPNGRFRGVHPEGHTEQSWNLTDETAEQLERMIPNLFRVSR